VTQLRGGGTFKRWSLVEGRSLMECLQRHPQHFLFFFFVSQAQEVSILLWQTFQLKCNASTRSKSNEAKRQQTETSKTMSQNKPFLLSRRFSLGICCSHEKLTNTYAYSA
jgi:site-specific DNA-adenine methylase